MTKLVFFSASPYQLLSFSLSIPLVEILYVMKFIVHVGAAYVPLTKYQDAVSSKSTTVLTSESPVCTISCDEMTNRGGGMIPCSSPVP